MSTTELQSIAGRSRLVSTDGSAIIDILPIGLGVGLFFGVLHMEILGILKAEFDTLCEFTSGTGVWSASEQKPS
jgi:hypothetical protein